MSVNLGTAYAELKLDTKGFKTGIDNAKKDLTSFKSQSEIVASGLKGVGTAMTNVGKTLTTAVTAPIVAFGTAAVKTTATFDQSMSKVQALSGATGKELQLLRNTAIEMGAKTAFSASQAADAMGYMALAGWKTEEMVAALPGVLDLAASSQMDLAQASDLVTDYLTAFGLEAGDATKMANELAYAQANSNTTTQALGEAFKNSASGMHTAGQTMETTIGLLGTLANQGLKGSEAGTALAATVRDITSKMDTYNDVTKLTKLSEDGFVSVTGDMNDILGKSAIKIGNVLVPVSDLNGNFRNMIDIMSDVEKATDGMGSAQKSAALQTTFTARSIRAASMIINAGTDSVYEFTDAITQMGDSQYAGDTAQTMLQNLNGQLTILKSELETLSIQIGDILMPYITKFVSKVQELTVWFTNLSTEQKKQIVQWAAIAASIGPVLLLFGKLLTSASGIITAVSKIAGWLPKFASAFGLASEGATGLTAALTGIGSTLGPILAVGAAIAALAASLVALYQRNGEFTASVNETFTFLKEKALEVWNGIKEIFEQLKGYVLQAWDILKNTIDFTEIDIAMGKLVDAWHQLQEATAPNIAILTQFAKVVLAGLVIPALSALVAGIQQTITVLPYLINAVTETINIFMSMYKIVQGIITGLLTGDFTLLKEGTQKLCENLWNILKNLVKIITEGAKSFFTNFINNLNVFTGNLVTKVNESIKILAEKIMYFFTVTIPAQFNKFTTETLPNFISKAKEFFDKLPYNLGLAIGEALGKLRQWGVDMLSWVAENLPTIINNIVNFFKELPGKIWTHLSAVIDKVKTWGGEMKAKATEFGQAFLDNLITKVKEVPGKVYEWIKQAPGKVLEVKGDMSSAGSSIITALLEGMKSAFTKVTEWMAAVSKKIKEFVKGIKEGIEKAAKSGGNEEASATENSSSTSNLAYMAYDNYRNSIQQIDESPNKNNSDNSNKSGSVGYTFIFNSPEKIDPYEANRLFRQSVRELEEGFA